MSASHDNTLTTTGQLDWTSLSRSTITVSLDVLARYALAGVDVSTVAMSRVLGSRFAFPPEGQRELMSSLNQLKGVSSFSNTLWIGFGIKHLVRSLVETEQGALFVALCAALGEGREELYDVSCILREMCLVVDFPLDFAPSVHQWKMLAGACEGCLRASHFPHVYHHFFRLLVPAGTSSGPTKPRPMAEALLALGKLSRNEIVHAVFAGTGDCALLAAIALCLLGLHVEIHDGDGVVLYMNQVSHNSTAVFIRKSPEWRTGTASHRASPRDGIVLETYYEVVANDVFESSSDFYGPTTWSTVLSDAFGAEWQALKTPDLAQALHDLLRITATRLVPGLSFGFPFDNMRRRTLSDPLGGCDCSDSAHGGVDPMELVYDCLPELAELRPLWSGMVHTDVRTCLDKFTTACHGIQCESCSLRFFPNCLTYIAESVALLAWCLRGMRAVHPAVPPSPSGLRKLARKYRDRDRDRDRDGEEQHTTSEYLNILHIVFTGKEWIPSIPIMQDFFYDWPVAVSSKGVCIYLPVLKDPLLPTIDAISPEIMPGRITWLGRDYGTVTDGSVRYSSPGLKATDVGTPTTSRMQLIASETKDPGRLDVVFRWTLPSGSKIHYPPAEAAADTMGLFLRASQPPEPGMDGSPVDTCDKLLSSHHITLNGQEVTSGKCGDQPRLTRVCLVFGEGADLLAVDLSSPLVRFAQQWQLLLPQHDHKFWAVWKISNYCHCCILAASWILGENLSSLGDGGTKVDDDGVTRTGWMPPGGLTISILKKNGSFDRIKALATRKSDRSVTEGGT